MDTSVLSDLEEAIRNRDVEKVSCLITHGNCDINQKIGFTKDKFENLVMKDLYPLHLKALNLKTTNRFIFHD